VFDVTDVGRPTEKFKTTIGDRGTSSELLEDHKALLFAREKQLLAFPVTVMSLSGPAVTSHNGYDYPNYGDFTFQGAYVYQLDMEKGFTLKGRVTHISDPEYQNAGDYWYDSDKNIDRIGYIGDTLYCSSGAYISAHGLSALGEQGRAALP
jgi:hypothetical protein